MLKKVLTAAVMTGSVVLSAGEVFRADFEKDLQAVYNGRSYKPVNRMVALLSRPGKGADGKGRAAVFARENLKEFSDLAENIKAEMHNITWHCASKGRIVEKDSGTISLMVYSRFNQISPYPTSNPGFTNYSIFTTQKYGGNAPKPGNANIISCWIMGKYISAAFLLADNSRVNISGRIDKWAKNEWHKVQVSWDAQEVLLLVDGKVLSRKKINKAVRPFDIIMIGGSYNGCNMQGMLDDLIITDEKVAVEAAKPVVKENF